MAAGPSWTTGCAKRLLPAGAHINLIDLTKADTADLVDLTRTHIDLVSRKEARVQRSVRKHSMELAVCSLLHIRSKLMRVSCHIAFAAMRRLKIRMND